MGKIVLKADEKKEEEPKKEKKTKLGKCENCGKALEAYVVSNGKLFCCDLCVKESLK